jgi:hypothetical protein
VLKKKIIFHPINEDNKGFLVPEIYRGKDTAS